MSVYSRNDLTPSQELVLIDIMCKFDSLYKISTCRPQFSWLRLESARKKQMESFTGIRVSQSLSILYVESQTVSELQKNIRECNPRVGQDLSVGLGIFRFQSEATQYHVLFILSSGILRHYLYTYEFCFKVAWFMERKSAA